jgi:gluconolactonase
MRIIAYLIVGTTLALFSSPMAAQEDGFATIGKVHRYSPALDALLAPDARVEQLTDRVFRWSEGPAWVREGDYLLFSDVPENTIWQWSDQAGLEVFLKPSTLQDDRPRDPGGQGVNGLYPLEGNAILAADHGSRAVLKIDLATRQKSMQTGLFDGKRFNSPNDLVVSRVRWPGTVFFTDPPYGLTGQDDSPLKELSFNGVYRLDPSGVVTLLDDSMIRPNGIALSPDEQTLYVANSRSERAVWIAFALDAQGSSDGPGRVFASAQRWADEGRKGNPDGLAVDINGNLWATGPGGVFVIDPDGNILGLIETGTAVANCAFGGKDGSVLYLTSHRFLARINTQTRGLVFETGR